MGAIMTVCNRCGKENQDHYKFCLGCGAELTAAPKPGGGDMAMMKTMMADPGASPVGSGPIGGGPLGAPMGGPVGGPMGGGPMGGGPMGGRGSAPVMPQAQVQSQPLPRTGSLLPFQDRVHGSLGYHDVGGLQALRTL
ncbi:MAG TPA: zinc ribbon domain-containing protein, partial [Kofleriaceae bacterium]|nr:zinc ribbon domain-containing protein [Kofleriaceae bacterium]